MPFNKNNNQESSELTGSNHEIYLFMRAYIEQDCLKSLPFTQYPDLDQEIEDRLNKYLS